MPMNTGSDTQFLSDLLYSPGDDPFIFFDTSRRDEENYRSLAFPAFDEVIMFFPRDDVDKFFTQLERYLQKGYWLAGYFTYEFGYWLDHSLRQLQNTSIEYPLAWIGVSKEPFFLKNPYGKEESLSAGEGEYSFSDLTASISAQEYERALSKIKEYLEKGDTYQVNYSFKMKFGFQGNMGACYHVLRAAQPTAYSAFIYTKERSILSFSPELFFRIEGGRIVSKPMKGTIARGKSFKEDQAQAACLFSSEKNRAENVMIVDLLRNDLGRLACAGTVTVPRIFEIEKYPTVYQMTSKIQARLKPDVSLRSVFTSLFPCGSVTGAPKIRTMQIIHELEKEARGIYTGAIGFISPGHTACFNVAIRTIEIDRQNQGCLGIGGGIVYDSVHSLEYQEAHLKAQFILQKPLTFSLIETLAWDGQEGYLYLSLHIERLYQSSQYFDFFCSPDVVMDKLHDLEKTFLPGHRYCVRLLLHAHGDCDLVSFPCENVSWPVRVEFSDQPVDCNDKFLFHKTTNRKFYDEQRRAVLARGNFEVLFTNRQGQLTEGTITNIFIEKEGTLYTPSLECGLLPGVLREYLLRSGKVQEAVLYPADLFTAQKVFIGNSVRGLIPAEICFGGHFPGIPSPQPYQGTNRPFLKES